MLGTNSISRKATPTTEKPRRIVASQPAVERSGGTLTGLSARSRGHKPLRRGAHGVGQPVGTALLQNHTSDGARRTCRYGSCRRTPTSSHGSTPSRTRPGTSSASSERTWSAAGARAQRGWIAGQNGTAPKREAARQCANIAVDLSLRTLTAQEEDVLQAMIAKSDIDVIVALTDLAERVFR